MSIGPDSFQRMVTVSPLASNGADLAVLAGVNLTSAWLAQAQRLVDGPGTVCGITAGSEHTYIAICQQGEVIDTACLALGWDSLRYDSDWKVNKIHEDAETFLDAVAKDLKVGDQTTEEFLALLSNLICETIVNTVWRKRPPQVSQRLLCSEPLSAHYTIDKYFITTLAAEDASVLNLRTFIASGLQGSLEDRQLSFEQLPCASFSTEGLYYEQEAISIKDISTSEYWQTQFVDLPVMALPLENRNDNDIPIQVKNRLTEHIRRYQIGATEPVAIMTSSTLLPALRDCLGDRFAIFLVTDDESVTCSPGLLARLTGDAHVYGGDYLSLAISGEKQHAGCLKRIAFPPR